MIVDIAFTHLASVRLGRRRTYETFVFPASVTTDIFEATAEACPVALRYPGSHSDYVRGVETVELRLHDGRLHRPVVHGDNGLKDWTHKGPVRLGQAAAADSRFPFTTSRGKRTKTMPAPLADTPAVSAVGESCRPTKEAGVLAWASNALLIDGLLWEAAPEPVIGYRTNGRCEIVEDGAKTTLLALDRMSFRIDEGDLAREWMTAFTGKDHDAPPAIHAIIPGAIRFDSALLRLRLTAEFVDGAMFDHRTTPAYAAAKSEIEAALKDLVDDARPAPEKTARPAAAMRAGIAIHCEHYDESKTSMGAYTFDSLIANCEKELDAWVDAHAPDDPDLAPFGRP